MVTSSRTRLAQAIADLDPALADLRIEVGGKLREIKRSQSPSRVVGNVELSRTSFPSFPGLELFLSYWRTFRTS
jgi:hypothetical protein